MLQSRIRKKCQPQDNAGYDEDGYRNTTMAPGSSSGVDSSLGHVEKTNDRDYEVEERYAPIN